MITIKTGGTNTVVLGFLHLVILFFKKKKHWLRSGHAAGAVRQTVLGPKSWESAGKDRERF